MDAEPDIAAIGAQLTEAAVAATPAWVRQCAAGVAQAQGLKVDEAALADAATRAQRFVEARLSDLMAIDIDRQQTTPLSIFRDAVRFPVEVLHQSGAQPIHRGDVSRWAFPNDPFGVTPGNLADIGPDVHEAGIVWGAAKAAIHLARRRTEGKER